MGKTKMIGEEKYEGKS